MKLLSKPSSLAGVGWFLVLGAALWLLYLLFNQLGFSSTASKGLSLLALLVLIAMGLIAQRQWVLSRWDRRFRGLSLEQQMEELERVIEEQVAAGVITRKEIDGIRVKSEARFKRQSKH